MFPVVGQYLTVLESFKEKKISALLLSISEKVISTIQGPHFSDEIIPYFKELNVENIADLADVPFHNFETEPLQVVQIKKILNALYHARKAFLELEAVDLRNGNNKIKDIKTLYNSTIDHAYKACYLITHLDLNLLDTFSQEVNFLKNLVKAAEEFNNKHLKEAEAIVAQIKQYPISHEAGRVAGTAIHQMQPNQERVDYNFLTQFSAVLPSYIQKASDCIRQFSSDISAQEPTLNIEALKDDAMKLLWAIDSLQDNTALLSLKVINYISIVRHIITLSSSSLEQMGHVSNTSQDAIRSKLSTIKYELMPQLFAITDKLEDELMLSPGTFSTPVMETMRTFYQLIIHYASKPVDFAAKGEDLLTLEDRRFTQIRLANTEARITKAKQEAFKAKEAQDALNHFFLIIGKKKYEKNRVMDMIKPTKTALRQFYRVLQPYVETLDIELHNDIVYALSNEPSTLSDYTINLYGKWKGSRYNIPTDRVMTIEKKLRDHLTVIIETSALHIKLNEDIIKQVYNNTTFALSPHPIEQNILALDEAKILGIENRENTVKSDDHTLISNPKALTTDQILTLSDYYHRNHQALLTAKEAFTSFIELIALQPNISLRAQSNENKQLLRALYAYAQPYFVSAFHTANDTSTLDKLILENLSDTPISSSRPSITFQQLNVHKNSFIERIDETIIFCDTQARTYQELAKEAFKTETNATPLASNPKAEERCHYVFKDTHRSKAVLEFRMSLQDLTRFFNKPMRKRLKAQVSGLPFPELKDPNILLTLSKQEQSIKRLLNALYSLEQILIELEALDNNSTQIIYVQHLITAYNHIDDIRSLSIALYEDPYLRLLAKDFSSKAQTLYTLLKKETDPYLEKAPENPDEQVEVERTSLWYTMQTFMLIPDHLQALYEPEHPLTPNRLTQIRERTKQLTLKIEGVINNSHSYFRLLLKAPVMYELFKELRQKLHQFTNISHAAAIDHLQALKDDLFCRILSEADLWEDELNLEPGLLTDAMKDILDEFYKGLLESLHMPSKVHLQYIHSMQPFEKRKQHIKGKFLLALACDTDSSQYQKGCLYLREEDGLVGGSYLNNAGRITHICLRSVNAPSPFTLDALKALRQHILEEATRQGHVYEGRIHTYNKPLNEIKQKQSPLQSLKAAIDAHTSYRPSFGTDTKQILNAAFENASPILTELIPQLQPNYVLPTVDTLKNPEILQGLLALTNTTLRYYDGLSESSRLMLKTARTKLKYLNTLQREQKTLNDQYTLDYTNSAFTDHLNLIISKQVSMIYVKNEYKNMLKKYLLSFQESIVNQSVNAEDIHESIEVLVARKIETFETTHVKHFKQLNNIWVAITEFNRYLAATDQKIQNSKSLPYENSDTLAKKSEAINTLSAILENKCGLIRMSEDPNNLTTERLKILLDNNQSYALFNSKIYYISYDFTCRELTSPNIDELQSVFPVREDKMEYAAKKDLKAITASTSHSVKRTISERINDAKTFVSSNTFNTIMIVEHPLYSGFSFAWLQRCILSLLTALHIYTPKHIKCYKGLSSSLGIFAQPATEPNQPATPTMVAAAG